MLGVPRAIAAQGFHLWPRMPAPAVKLMHSVASDHVTTGVHAPKMGSSSRLLTYTTWGATRAELLHCRSERSYAGREDPCGIEPPSLARQTQPQNLRLVDFPGNVLCTRTAAVGGMIVGWNRDN